MNREPDHNPRKALGKGLSALLPSRSAAPVAVSQPEHFEEFQSISLNQIQPGEEQPRDLFDGQKMEELSQSIRANGVLQPIVVYRDTERANHYRIIAGERRWRAAGLAGLKEIPALVRSVEREQLLELSLIENIQREDLNPIEIAMAFYRLATQHGMSHEQIAERTGKERSTVTNFLRLLRLGARAQDDLRSGRITVGHARVLLNLPDESQQDRLCEEIIAKKLSVREVEALVKRLTEKIKSPQTAENKEETKLDPNIRAALEEMEMALGTRVKLVAKSPSSGRLEIQYYSQDDLDRIYSVIVKQ
jgi:ParB family chromosome partitioning protein